MQKYAQKFLKDWFEIYKTVKCCSYMLITYISIKVRYSSISNAIHLFKQRWK